MRIRKGKTDVKIKLRNIATVAAATFGIVTGYNRRLKYNKKDKIGWLEVGLGTFMLLASVKKILDDNFIPEKEDQTSSGMKDMSTGTVE